MLELNTVLKKLPLYSNKDMTVIGCKVLACAMQHNHVLEVLCLPDDDRDCRWAKCVMFFTGCNRMHFWNVMQDENATIPWHKAICALLSDCVDPWIYRVESSCEAFRLSMVFLLLRNRPDVVSK
mmetsp:Transcript_22935/g.53150  ORF Transcript_22935/g.53150 Transcript_22935/m.53150 type:complete len:124 (+) Transcript_22935:1245-1616(+)